MVLLDPGYCGLLAKSVSRTIRVKKGDKANIYMRHHTQYCVELARLISIDLVANYFVSH